MSSCSTTEVTNNRSRHPVVRMKKELRKEKSTAIDYLTWYISELPISKSAGAPSQQQYLLTLSTYNCAETLFLTLMID